MSNPYWPFILASLAFTGLLLAGELIALRLQARRLRREEAQP